MAQLKSKLPWELLRYLGTVIFLFTGFWWMLLPQTIIWPQASNFIAFCLLFLLEPVRRPVSQNLILVVTSFILFMVAFSWLVWVDYRSLVLLPLLALLTYFYHQQQQKRQQEINDIYLKEYLQQLEQSSQQLRQFKHDYENILLSMEGYLKTEDLAGLKQYYLKNIWPTLSELDSGSHEAAKLAKLAVPPLKSLLVNKVMVAEALHLKVSLEIPATITRCPGDLVTTVRGLGILLDNALEASCQTENKWLKIACFTTGNSLKFIIENPFAEKLPPLHVLQQQNFSSKEGHAGLGLSNLQQLLAKRPEFLLDTVITEGTFTQILSIEEQH